jgi:hypothetical protein
MRRVDVGLIGLGFFIIIGFVLMPLNPSLNELLMRFPMTFAFIKFALVAIQGDALVQRLRHGSWQVLGWPYKMLVWGLLGVVIRQAFITYETWGSWVLDQQSLLVRAVLISLVMNATFAPVMMSVHRLTDAFIEKALDSNIPAIQTLSWVPFYRFIFFKTLPFFWFPAHVLTFLMPSAWRVLYAAVLGVMLGVFQALSKSRPTAR